MQKAIPRTRSGFTRVQALNRPGNKTFQIRTALAQNAVYMSKHNLVVVPELATPPSKPSSQIKKANAAKAAEAEFIDPHEPDETEETEVDETEETHEETIDTAPKKPDAKPKPSAKPKTATKPARKPAKA